MKTKKQLLFLVCLAFFQSVIWAGENDIKINEKATINQDIQFEENTLPLCPQIDISVNIGYSYIYTRTKNISGAEKKMEDDLSSGLNWDVRFHNYFKPYWGLGAVYSGYHASSANYLGTDLDANITYIAPLFCAKGYIGRTNLMLRSEIGLGYLHLKETVSMNGLMADIKGSTVGYNCTVGLEYQLAKNFGLGVDLEGIFGSFGHLKDSQGNKYDAPDNERMGLSRINILFGIRYYIK